MMGHEMGNFLEPTSDPAWVLAAQGYDPVREGIYEARFAISNGFLGIRAGRAVSRGSRWLDPQRTYVAGLFDIPGSEQPIPQLVTAPGFLAIRIIPDGGLLVHHPAEVGSHRTTLDMRRGTLLTEASLADDPRIAVRVRTLRIVSLDDRAVGVHVVEVEVEEGDIGVTIETSFEGLGLGFKTEQLEQDLGIWRTQNTGKRLAVAASSSLQVNDADITPTRPGPFAWSWQWTTRPGQIVRLVRVVAVARADAPDSDPGQVGTGKRSESPGGSGGKRWCNNTRLLGQRDGSIATSKLQETRQRSRRCALRHTTSTALPIRPMSEFPLGRVV